MAYRVGSLADLISGTHDASSSKIIYVPVEEKLRPTNDSHTTSHQKKDILHDQLTTGNSEIKRKRKYSDIAKEQPEENLEKEPHFSTRPRHRKKIQKVDKELESRTVFVKNLPHTVNIKHIKKNFKVFGTIESVRFRCAPVENPKIQKKVAVIKKSFHPERSNICAFVRFKDIKCAEEALRANGTLVGDHHIFVTKSLKEENYDQKKAVFLGNVPFGAEENDIWNLFAECGEIVDIRIVRDRETGLGKGIAFVNFKSTDAVELAVSRHGVKLKENELRVSRAMKKPVVRQRNIVDPRKHADKRGKYEGARSFHEKKNKGNVNNIRRQNIEENRLSSKGRVPESKEGRFNSGEQIDRKKKKLKNVSVESVKHEKNLHQQFEGQKMTEKKKKKKKINKNELRKKIIAKKLASVSKKHKLSN